MNDSSPHPAPNDRRPRRRAAVPLILRPPCPLQPGPPLPLCTAPARRRWHAVHGSFGRLRRHYSGPSLDEVRA